MTKFRGRFQDSVSYTFRFLNAKGQIYFSYSQLKNGDLLHGPSMFAVKAKIYGVIYNPASSIDFNETSSYWSAPKNAPNFSAFHWSPHGRMVSIGQHFVTTMVVHLPKRTETGLITEADLITESDQAIRAVHS